jgi:hypothetical protein
VRKKIEQLRLGLGRRFHRPEKFQVVGADVRNDSDRGSGYFTELGGLAEIIDSHLNDRSLMVIVEAEQGLWNAYTVVEVAFRLENFPSMRQDPGDHFFRRGLAVASRNGNDRNVKSASVIRSQLLVSREWIADAEDKRLGPPWSTLESKPRYVKGITHNGSHRPARQRGGHKVVAVESISLQRQKEITRPKRPSIKADSSDTAPRPSGPFAGQNCRLDYLA